METRPEHRTHTRISLFAKYAWLVLVYNVGVVLWGAYVRATGSGAGCGAHWPLCNGEVIPVDPSAARIIEFTHRLSSGLTLFLVFVLFVLAFRAYPKKSNVRLGAALALVFTVSEALVGAGLVLFHLVAQNTSVERTISTAIHLANTFLLLGSLTLTAYWASGGKPLRRDPQALFNWLIIIGLAGVLVVGVTGSITALGDTLFPSGSLVESLNQDLNPASQFLVRLRVIHPLIAMSVGTFVIVLTRILSSLRPGPGVKRMSQVTAGLVLSQWIAGFVNIFLLAPIWLQMTHLLLADLVWIAFVLFVSLVLGETQPNQATREPLKRVLEAILNPG